MNWRLTPFTGRELVRFPDNPFAKIQRELNKVIDDVWSGLPLSDNMTSMTSIRVDVKEDEKAYHVTADLPGMTEKEVDVSFRDGVLTLRGEKKVERDEKKDTWHIIERSSGSFIRQFNLPCGVDEEKIVAKFDKGVLSIELPKKLEDQSKAKKIEIKSS